MTMRVGPTLCSVPDAMVDQVIGMQFSRTELTWPGGSKHSADAEHFCLDLNRTGSDQSPARYPGVTICFQKGCSRVGSLEVLMGEH